MKKTIITYSQDQTEELGKSIGAAAKPGDIFTLDGDLGAGKTALIRGMAAGLGIQETITSPTFTIVNEYESRIPLFHFDLYRISDMDELLDIGWEDYLGRNGVIAVEWANRAPEIYAGAVQIRIEKHPVNPDCRIITIEGESQYAPFGN